MGIFVKNLKKVEVYTIYGYNYLGIERKREADRLKCLMMFHLLYDKIVIRM